MDEAGPITTTVLSTRIRAHSEDWFGFDTKTWAAWLEEIYGRSRRATLDAGGEVVGFTADTVDCVFDTNAGALAAAAAIHDDVTELLSQTGSLFARMTAAIGVHRCELLKAGRPYTSDLAIVGGYAATLASRIAGLCSKVGTDILVSETAMCDTNAFAFTLVESIPIKGTSAPLALFAGSRRR